MEIRIAYHPSSDTLMNRISDLLKENGITAEIKTASSAINSDVQISMAQQQETAIAHTLLDSSFVHTEQQPGY